MSDPDVPFLPGPPPSPRPAQPAHQMLSGAEALPEASPDAVVEAVLERLNELQNLPVAEHAALYGELHDGLLAVLDTEPGAAR